MTASAAIDANTPLAVSVRETGHLLGLGKDTVYRLVADGTLNKLPIDGPVRITVASIDRLLEQAENGSALATAASPGGSPRSADGVALGRSEPGQRMSQGSARANARSADHRHPPTS